MQRNKKRTSDMLGADKLIIAAKTMVARKVPYFNEITLRLRPTPVDGIGTMSCDKKFNLYYDPITVVEWWNTPCKPGHPAGCLVAGVLYHEDGHCIRDHFGRCQGRDHKKFNVAGDAEINDDCETAGFCLPKGCIMPSTLGMKNGLIAEVYYDGIKDEDT